MATMIDLDSCCTQEIFGGLVGISRQAVAKHLEGGSMTPGATLGQWMLEYTVHLREHAAGRGENGELAFQRSELARVSRERAEIKLAIERRESAPVALLSAVLATVARGIVSALEPLPNILHKSVPELTPEGLMIVQKQVSIACDLAATCGLELLDSDGDSAAEAEPEFLEGVDDE